MFPWIIERKSDAPCALPPVFAETAWGRKNDRLTEWGEAVIMLYYKGKNGGIKMGYQIYCGKGFDTQKAERFFKERRVSYQRVDVLKYGIGKRELESVAAAVGLDALCDRESKAYRESVIAYTQSRDSILAGLMEKPQLLKLPIVRDGRRATVGYCPEIWEAWLKG